MAILQGCEHAGHSLVIYTVVTNCSETSESVDKQRAGFGVSCLQSSLPEQSGYSRRGNEWGNFVNHCSITASITHRSFLWISSVRGERYTLGRPNKDKVWSITQRTQPWHTGWFYGIQGSYVRPCSWFSLCQFERLLELIHLKLLSFSSVLKKIQGEKIYFFYIGDNQGITKLYFRTINCWYLGLFKWAFPPENSVN